MAVSWKIKSQDGASKRKTDRVPGVRVLRSTVQERHGNWFITPTKSREQSPIAEGKFFAAKNRCLLEGKTELLSIFMQHREFVVENVLHNSTVVEV